MFFFAAGTLPALISVSAISSIFKGRSQEYLLKFAGVIAVLLGLFNIQNGLVLAGNPLIQLSQKPDAVNVQLPTDPNVNLVNGQQVVKMKVDYIDYYPHQFTVKKGVPVVWEVDGSRAAGCMSSLLVPGLGIREYLPRTGTKQIVFTPQKTGTFPFHCSMGMGTYGAAITVVDPAPQALCDPKVTNCITG